MLIFTIGLLVGWLGPSFVSHTVGYGLVPRQIGSTVEWIWDEPRWDRLQKQTRLLICWVFRAIRLEMYEPGEIGSHGKSVWIVESK